MQKIDPNVSRKPLNEAAPNPGSDDDESTESSSEEETSSEGSMEYDSDPNDYLRDDDMEAAIEERPSSSSSSSSEESSDEESEPDPAEVEEPMRGEMGQAASGSSRVGLQPRGNIQSSDLSSRIASFLPALRASNAQIQQAMMQGQGNAHSLEVRDGERVPHINMNLSLGVLERIDENRKKVDSDDEDGGDTSSGIEPLAASGGEKKRKPGVLDTLMGRPKKSKPSIDEIEDAGT